MWLELLKTAVSNSNNQAVADELGVSRTVISLVMNGKYPASTDKIAEKVMSQYSRVTCPHTNESITIVACKQNHTSSAPTSSPRTMRLWRACQTCPNNSGAKHE